MWAFGMPVYNRGTKFAMTGGKLPPRPMTLDDSPAFFRSVWKICESCWVSPPDDRIIIKEVVCYLRSRDQLGAGNNRKARMFTEDRVFITDNELAVDVRHISKPRTKAGFNGTDGVLK